MDSISGSGRKAPEGPRANASRPRIPSLFWLLLALIGGWLLAQSLAESAQHRVSYSEFVQAADDRKFDAVEIGDGWARGHLASPPEKPPAGKKEESLPWYTNLVPGTEPALAQTLQAKGIRISAVPRSGFGGLLLAWGLPLLVVLLFWNWMFRRMAGPAGPGRGLLSFGRMSPRILAEAESTVRFSDVAGVDEAVDELREIVEFLKTPEKFRRLGARIPKGVLLVGPPGTGKTLLARAVAGEAHAPFFSLTGSQFVEMFVGVGAARVRDLFQQAQARAPCIVFIDELDAVGKTRTTGMLAHEEREQTLDQLLAEMDGFDPRVGLIVLAATNRPEVLDPALLRPGRFDRQVLVDRPDRRGREKILRIHARGVKLATDVDLARTAAETPGFVGADLANVVNEAALLAARRGKEEVTRAEFDEAVERVVAGLEKKSRRLDARERDVVAHHEAGHALVGWMLPRAERVRKVSIIPRGIAALGYTMQRPFEDRYLTTEPELRAKIATLLAGRAAEELFFGELSSGSATDLALATDLARAMVRDYGMSSRIGPLALGGEHRATVITPQGPQPFAETELSERLHEAMDEEIRRVITEGEVLARRVVHENREKLEELAARLLRQEVVEEDELARIFGPKAGRHEERETGGVYAPPAPPMHAEPPAPSEP